MIDCLSHGDVEMSLTRTEFPICYTLNGVVCKTHCALNTFYINELIRPTFHCQQILGHTKRIFQRR